MKLSAFLEFHYYYVSRELLNALFEKVQLSVLKKGNTKQFVPDSLKFHWHRFSNISASLRWTAAVILSLYIGRLHSPSSVVRHPHSWNIFSSETAGPIKAKFHIEPQWDGEMKVCSGGLGHMTKMSTMPKYGKSPLKIFSRTKGPMTLGQWPLKSALTCLYLPCQEN